MDELRKSIEQHQLAQRLQVETLGKGLDTSKLTKKIVTDKNGKKTTKWVKTEGDHPKVEASKNKLMENAKVGSSVISKVYMHRDKGPAKVISNNQDKLTATVQFKDGTKSEIQVHRLEPANSKEDTKKPKESKAFTDAYERAKAASFNLSSQAHKQKARAIEVRINKIKRQLAKDPGSTANATLRDLGRAKKVQERLAKEKA